MGRKYINSKQLSQVQFKKTVLHIRNSAVAAVSRDHFLSAEEIKALLGASDSNVVSITGKKIEQKQAHLKPIIIFALNTGCHKDEILSMKWENVDLKHGFINVTGTKNGERRQIPIWTEKIKVAARRLLTRVALCV